MPLIARISRLYDREQWPTNRTALRPLPSPPPAKAQSTLPFKVYRLLGTPSLIAFKSFTRQISQSALEPYATVIINAAHSLPKSNDPLVLYGHALRNPKELRTRFPYRAYLANRWF